MSVTSYSSSQSDSSMSYLTTTDGTLNSLRSPPSPASSSTTSYSSSTSLSSSPSSSSSLSSPASQQDSNSCALSVDRKKEDEKEEERKREIGDVSQRFDALGIKDENMISPQKSFVPGGSATPSDNAAVNPMPGSSGLVDVGGAVGGAEGGATGGMSQRPNTVNEFLQMQGAQQMYAVQPLTWCPHLTELQPLPSRPLTCGDPCTTCGDVSENWVCLVCYTVACSRFVNEHMLYHRLESEHNLTLSYSDLSVWCYACDHYVDNEVLQPVKNAAHISKFGEALSGFQ